MKTGRAFPPRPVCLMVFLPHFPAFVSNTAVPENHSRLLSGTLLMPVSGCPFAGEGRPANTARAFAAATIAQTDRLSPRGISPRALDASAPRVIVWTDASPAPTRGRRDLCCSVHRMDLVTQAFRLCPASETPRSSGTLTKAATV